MGHQLTRPSPYDPFEAESWQGFFRDVYAFLSMDTTATLNFPSIAAATVAVLTVTIRGATPGPNSLVLLGPPSTIEAGLIWSGFVSANDTVSIRLFNGTAGAIDPAAASWRVAVLRY